MLVLSRKIDQKILIGKDIIVSVFEIKGDQVKIGIDAPKHVRVYRQEVYESIQEENRMAALSDIESIKDIPSDYFQGADREYGRAL